MTELIWEGKYDKDGQKVAPLRVRLPFQTVETVNESAQERQHTLDLFSSGRSSEWRNRLIWGDKKYILPSLFQEFAGQIDLIYIDPPFDTGADFSFQAQVNGEGFTKEASIIEQKAYRDIWGVTPEERAKGKTHVDRYLQWFYETVVLLGELLADTGSLYVHIGPNMSHYVKPVLDEVFGSAMFRSEIVWRRSNAHNKLADQYGPIHDVLLFYTKSDDFIFTPGVRPFSKAYIEGRFIGVDHRGRYQTNYITGPGIRRGDSGLPWRGFNPTSHGRHWAIPSRLTALLDKDLTGMTTQEILGELLVADLIVLPKKTNGQPMYKQYITEGVSYQDIWAYQPNTRGVLHETNDCIDEDVKWIEQEEEKLPFPTQKPEGLLKRIIETSTRDPADSNMPDLVLDCFVGSGTMAAVAEKMGRRWIACDLGRFAIHVTRKRLLSIPWVKPFIVQNLGKYERQLWQTAEFGEQAEARMLAYRRFILELYHAQLIAGYTWLHGIKAGRMVYVGAVDSPVSTGDVAQIAAEFKRAIGTGKDAPKTNGVDVLGWDFAFELNEVAKQQAAQANINMRFLRIPREVLEKKAVEQGDIYFFELAALSVEMEQKGRSVTLKLTDFVIPPDDVPEDVRQTITHWQQWVDYWAVDWNNRGDNFHNEWQNYRTRKKRELQKVTTHTYEQPGTYIIVVKVIDILGNDTTKTLRLEVY